MDDTTLLQLKKLREPFAPNQISRLPKPTKSQTDAVKADFKIGIRCKECGTWHHKDVVHLDYVGHAALTDRLLEVDPAWNWKPVSTVDGHPVLDADGGMWIELTVCGVTRLGYGDAQGKIGGNATKERIGDALRNAAMRFGAALDLWHKGDLHVTEDAKDEEEKVILPECTAKKFEAMCIDKINGETGEIEKMGWKSIVQSGSKSAEYLINMLQTKMTFTDEQKDTILSWETK
jgi:hypothetical protein